MGSILTVHAFNKSGVALATFVVLAFFHPEIGMLSSHSVHDVRI